MPHLKTVIVDYGMGNLFSVRQACEHVGLDTVITSDKAIIADADAIILPGVGAFGDAMANLRKLKLIAVLKDFIASGRPFMGICLGMQLLMTESEEFGYHEGLNVIHGKVVRLPGRDPRNRKVKVPQVGWNTIRRPSSSIVRDWNDTPLAGIDNDEYMYFVHSYYVVPADKKAVLSVTNYGGKDYCSSLLRKNIFATQFHPEKSACGGLAVYKTWMSLINKKRGVR